MHILFLASALLGFLLIQSTKSALLKHHVIKDDGGITVRSVSVPFFASLERMSRLVDIAYCVGTTGVSPPFSCASRCKDFPTLHLVSTWDTGILMSDSCGYIAVDHGSEKTKNGDIPHDPAIVVAFRGTYSITNTVVDLSTVPQEYVPYPSPDHGRDGDGDGDGDGNGGKQGSNCANCTVHMGFLASWRSAREVVLPHLKAVREKHPSYPIQLVGHSLGGAVAALAALELKLSLGWENLTVTTFGEPKVGNKALVQYLDRAFGLDTDDGYGPDLEKRPYRRVTHMNDPVPLLPLAEWGFQPHAGEIFISKADLQPAPEDLRICRGDSDTRCISGGGDTTSGYVALLESLLGDQETEAEIKQRTKSTGFPARLKLWQLFFAHRDYFWRLGLCVPGGDPSDWGRDQYNVSSSSTDEL